MSVVITRLFDTYEHACRAVADLEAIGLAHNAISLIANNSDGRYGDSVAAPGSAAPAAECRNRQSLFLDRRAIPE